MLKMFIKIENQTINLRHVVRITHSEGQHVAIKMDDGDFLKFENNPDMLYQRLVNQIDNYSELMNIR